MSGFISQKQLIPDAVELSKLRQENESLREENLILVEEIHRLKHPVKKQHWQSGTILQQ